MVSIIESSMLSALAGAESFMNNEKVHVLSFQCNEIVRISVTCIIKIPIWMRTMTIGSCQ